MPFSRSCLPETLIFSGMVTPAKSRARIVATLIAAAQTNPADAMNGKIFIFGYAYRDLV
jgi:hypothetical protein